MIKTTITKLPTTRQIDLICPTCNLWVKRTVLILQQKGSEECSLCHTQFDWEETEQGKK